MNRREYNSSVDQFSDGLYRFVLKSLSDSENARDIVQETFMKLWEKKDNVEFTKVKSYLFTTGYHTMIDFIRKNKRITQLDDSIEKDQVHTDQYSELSEILEEAVNRLPEVQRSVILLRDYEGYSYQEIGGILELKESQVKVYIFRARKYLQTYLKSVEAVL